MGRLLLRSKAMLSKLGTPNPISGIYANSYINDKSKENWRKPNPTMIIKALEDLGLNNENSILIGDRKSDIIAGIRAGITNIFHVKTGHGEREKQELIRNLDYNLLDLNKSNLKFINNLTEFPLNFFRDKTFFRD